jgi:hypothetical protein
VMDGDTGATVVLRGGGVGSGGREAGVAVVLGRGVGRGGGETGAVEDAPGAVGGRTGAGFWGMGANALGWGSKARRPIPHSMATEFSSAAS